MIYSPSTLFSRHKVAMASSEASCALMQPECSKLTRGWIAPAVSSCSCCNGVSQHFAMMAAVNSAIMAYDRPSDETLPCGSLVRKLDVVSSRVTRSWMCLSYAIKTDTFSR